MPLIEHDLDAGVGGDLLCCVRGWITYHDHALPQPFRTALQDVG